MNQLLLGIACTLCLALGGTFAALAAGAGWYGALTAFLLASLAGALLVWALLRRRAAALAYAAAGLLGGTEGAWGSETVAAPPPSQAAGLEARSPAPTAEIPLEFDRPTFLRNAKLNFVRLQVANDRADLEAIRQVTTAEMYEEIRRSIVERQGAAQQTDVVSLNADLLEVATDDGLHRAAVHFSGMVWEIAGSAPVGFEEIWSLVKPVDGSSGWLLAGIEHAH